MTHRHDTVLLQGPDRDGRRAHLRLREPVVTRAVVLVMHGGQVSNHRPARWAHLSVRRMQPFAHEIWRRRHHEGVAVGSLLFARRGWNGTGAPIADALWALEEIQARYGSVPVVLVGHSMGGRTALRVAGHHRVIGVVGLAPWVPAGEPTDQLAHRAVTILHGLGDRWVPADLSRAYIAELGDVPAAVDLTTLRGTGHAMVRRAATWHALTADAVDRILTPYLVRPGTKPVPPAHARLRE